MELSINFTLDDGVNMLKSLGLEVKLTEMPVSFPTHNGDSYEEMIPMWTVTNPNTGQVVPIRPLFQRYLNQVKKDVFLNPDKLQIFNLFDK